MTAPTPTQVPIKLYRSNDRLTVAAPMPGLEPGDISAEVTADHHLILHGEQRGAQKGVNDEIMNEWNAGPYHREIALPHPVDATVANVTYGNGVLVISLPLSDINQPAKLAMQQTSAAHGILEGATGHTRGTTSATTTGDESPLDAGGDAEDNDREPEGSNPDSFADISTADLMPDPLAQPLDTDAALVANDSVVEDEEIGDYQESQSDDAYFAPTDPVLTTNAHGDIEVLGGFEATSDDAISVDASTIDDIPGDEALRDAIRAALRHDATTTDLRLHVHVHNGIAHLRGTVADLTDADNAQDVASRVPGVEDVIDETEVAGL